MTQRPDRERGFTLVEMMVVIAVIAIIATAAAIGMGRGRPRATLAGATVELRSLMNQARQQALMSGANVAVMFFPGFSGVPNSIGRVVVYQDGDFSFFDPAAAIHFGGYDPSLLAAGVRGQVITTLDLPSGVVIGPATGLGGAGVLPAPLTTLPVNADCTFCAGGGVSRRGAVVFNSRGRASFYNADGLPLVVDGGSISLTAPDLDGGPTPLVRMLSVSATTGALQTVNQG